MAEPGAEEWTVGRPDIAVRALTGEEALERAPALAELLIDCVEDGASVSFLAPLDRGKALAFWQGVAAGVARGERILLAVEDGAGSGGVAGTVQVVLAQPENQPHRGDLAKMLVRRSARRRRCPRRRSGRSPARCGC